MCPTTTRVTSSILALSTHGSRVVVDDVGMGTGNRNRASDTPLPRSPRRLRWYCRTIGGMPLPRRQRVAAYAVVVRDERILLTRLAERISVQELWTLPGGGVDHGEDPRDAVVREIKEETGLDAIVGEQARVYSSHMPHARRDGRHRDDPGLHPLSRAASSWPGV